MDKTSLPLTLLLTAGGLMLTMLLIYVLIIAFVYQKGKPGQAIIRTGMGDMKVAFRGMFIVPLLHRKDVIDMTIKQIPISFSSRNPLIFQHGKKATFEAKAFIRVNMTAMDVQRVAMSISPEMTFSQDKLISLFQEKFLEGVRLVAQRRDLQACLESPEAFKQEILEVLGEDFNGYVLDDLVFNELNEI